MSLGATRGGNNRCFLNEVPMSQDAVICDEIYELRFTEDFEQMNQFFGTSTAAKPTPAGATASEYKSKFVPLEAEDITVMPGEHIIGSLILPS